MAMRRKAVLITGGTKRLGFEMAKLCLALDLCVVAHYRSSKGALLRWLRKRPHISNRVFFVQAELPQHAEGLVEQARRLPVRLVGLINNASIFTKGDLRDAAHFETTLGTNASAPLKLSAAFARIVRSGWIVNITDAHIDSMSATHQNYRISKKMLEHLTAQMAYAFAPGIRVNAIAPGAVLPPPGESRSYLRRLRDLMPLKRTVPVGDIARALTYLIMSSSTTGQILYVDCGWHLCP